VVNNSASLSIPSRGGQPAVGRVRIARLRDTARVGVVVPRGVGVHEGAQILQMPHRRLVVTLTTDRFL
jgi:hypothetical protein